MALIQSYEQTGNVLFKYRGQIPILIFLLALPILYFTNLDVYLNLQVGNLRFWRIFCIVLAFAVSLTGLVLRAYTVGTTPKGTSGRNTQSQVAKQLNTKGIYSVVRHPLYFANYLIWAGIMIFTMNIFAFVIVSLLYYVYYERIMFAEEAYLRQQFGEDFEEWAMRVPAFFPKTSLYEKGDLEFSFKTFIRREYTTIFSTVFTYVIVDYIMFILTCARFHAYQLPLNLWIRPSLYILLAFAVITITIKILKKHTTVLKSDGTRD